MSRCEHEWVKEWNKESCPYCAITQLQRELAAAQKRIMDYENREAQHCPEDVGFDEYIVKLQRELAAAVEAKASSDAAYARLMETAAKYRDERDEAVSERDQFQDLYEDSFARIADINGKLQSSIRANEELSKDNDSIRAQLARAEEVLREIANYCAWDPASFVTITDIAGQYFNAKEGK